jgi:hypothetical protein
MILPWFSWKSFPVHPFLECRITVKAFGEQLITFGRGWLASAQRWAGFWNNVGI